MQQAGFHIHSASHAFTNYLGLQITGGREKLIVYRSMGVKQYEPVTPKEAGFITASVVDPFGNIPGIMYNPHYLEILAEKEHEWLARGVRTGFN